MDWIAASRSPSAGIASFPSAILICKYCTVAVLMDVCGKELLQVVLELLHGQINNSQTGLWPRGLVLLGFFLSSASPQIWIPWNDISAAVR